MMDTLVVEKDGKYFLERYTEQDLDSYDHIAEVDHENLCNMKVMENKIGYWYMKSISIAEIMEYIKQFD